jgi:peroxiredoxin
MPTPNPVNKFVLFLTVGLLALSPSLSHADANSDWKEIEVLDKGPQKKPTTPEEVGQIARLHLAKQLDAVRTFAKNYPEDPRVFDAKLREADILAALGKMENDRKMVDSAYKLYIELEATPGLSLEKQADVSFNRVSLSMQNADFATSHGRDLVLNTIEGFRTKYPNDRRTPRLLVEVATLYDDQPKKKRELILAAKELSKDEELDLRIADDLKRLDLLGKPVNFSIKTIQGGTINTQALRGKVVAIVFWAAESPHCQIWMRSFRQATARYSPDSVAIVTISLDKSRTMLVKTMEQLRIEWPTNFDGLGWENPLARKYGINALPTLWILDKEGRLQALNARDNYEGWIRQLARER